MQYRKSYSSYLLVIAALVLAFIPAIACAQPLVMEHEHDAVCVEQDVLPCANSESVLNTYQYFICFGNSKHNVAKLHPTYKQLSFKTSYSRVYPDTCTSNEIATCAKCGSTGVLKSYQCRYKTW